jgi:hypothetical protein
MKKNGCKIDIIKKHENFMKNIKTFEQFDVNDPYGEEIDADLSLSQDDIPYDEITGIDDLIDIDDLYNVMVNYLEQANIIYCNYVNENPDEIDNCTSPEDAMECLGEIEEDHGLYSQAQELLNRIDELQDQIDKIESEEYFNDD